LPVILLTKGNGKEERPDESNTSAEGKNPEDGRRPKTIGERWLNCGEKRKDNFQAREETREVRRCGEYDLEWEHEREEKHNRLANRSGDTAAHWRRRTTLNVPGTGD